MRLAAAEMRALDRLGPSVLVDSRKPAIRAIAKNWDTRNLHAYALLAKNVHVHAKVCGPEGETEFYFISERMH